MHQHSMYGILFSSSSSVFNISVGLHNLIVATTMTELHTKFATIASTLSKVIIMETVKHSLNICQIK
jgi:hypothetical protein